jgi:hypothetical protein
VGGEDDGGAALTVDLGEEFSHRVLGDDVEADGRLVEEEDFGLVQQG